MKLFHAWTWLSLIAASKAAVANIRSPLRHEAHRNLATATLQLYNAKTDTKIADLVNGTVIALSDIPGMTTPSFNIVASYSGRVKSVKFGFNSNTKYHVENTAPFAFCGNNKQDYFSCPVLGLGTHTVTAALYGRKAARGRAQGSTKVSFTIVASKNPVPMAPQLPAPQNVPIAAPPTVPASPQAPQNVPIAAPPTVPDRHRRRRACPSSARPRSQHRHRRRRMGPWPLRLPSLHRHRRRRACPTSFRLSSRHHQSSRLQWPPKPQQHQCLPFNRIRLPLPLRSALP
jgi:hypothetical protein